jgi:serine/threonine protein kinase
MVIESTENLVSVLRQSELLNGPQLDELLMSLQYAFPEPADLADDLVRRGWLTRHQADLLSCGRAAELALGHYTLLEPLGAGGMARVFKARHRCLDRVDAVKIIRAEHLGDPRALRSFQQEARAAARLSHPNIVVIYDAGEVAGRHFLAMEYVAGGDLARLVKTCGPLPPALACDYAWQAALGLQHAFERDMVHRDVKPSNLLLTADRGLVKVLDMGLALLNYGPGTPAAAAPDREGAAVGTPDYVAPEQALDPHAVDIRADIYGLGCTLYFLLTGLPPYPGGSSREKVMAHLRAEAPPLRPPHAEAPPGLPKVVGHMMARRPGDRYQTPGEVAEALRPYCPEEGVLAALQELRKPVEKGP